MKGSIGYEMKGLIEDIACRSYFDFCTCKSHNADWKRLTKHEREREIRWVTLVVEAYLKETRPSGVKP